MTNTEVIAYQIELYQQNHKVVDLEDFRDDFGRIMSIIKALTSYHTTGQLKARIIINHLVVLTNSFGAYQVQLMFMKCPDRLINELYTFLDYMGYIPETGHVVISDEEFIDTNHLIKQPRIIELIEEELCRA